MQRFELSLNDTIKLLTWEPLLIVRLPILYPILTNNTMRPVRKKPYQEHPFSLRIPLELDGDDHDSLNLKHLYWPCLLGEVLQISPHNPLW
jgi:hypothetical protein